MTLCELVILLIQPNVHFSWHCTNTASKDTLYSYKERHLEWIVPKPGNQAKKKIHLHAHHRETGEHLGHDSMEVTIFCNTLKVGSISVADTALIPNHPLQFSVEVAENENLIYEWSFGDDAINKEPPPNRNGNRSPISESSTSFSNEIKPTHTYTQSGNYTITVTIKDTAQYRRVM